MSQPDSSDHEKADTRFQRHLWLLRISFGGRMLASHHYAVLHDSRDPTLQLYRAFHLLIHIVRVQIEEHVSFANTQLSSLSTWCDERFKLDEDWFGEFDPNDYERRSYMNPNVETFPECGILNDRPLMTFDTRLSRAVLFLILKATLTNGFYRGQSIQIVWGRLWEAFLEQLDRNKYLRCWHRGDVILQQWKTLSSNAKARFIDTMFALDLDTMKQSLQRCQTKHVEKPSVRRTEWYTADIHNQKASYALPLAWCGLLGEENETFGRYLQLLSDSFIDFAIKKGYEVECTNVSQWSRHVQDPADLEEDACPVCYLDYDITGASPKSSVPVQLSCGHIICLGCLKEWTQSHADNKDNCPICRRVLHPPNAHKQYSADLESALDKLDTDEGKITPQAYAQQAVAIMDNYFSKLPAPIADVHIRKFSTINPKANTIADIQCWLGNINGEPVDDTGRGSGYITEDISPDRSDLDLPYDMQGCAALHCLYWTVERLRAYLEGDQALHRKACEFQIYSYAHFENVSFCIMQQRWKTDFEKHLAQERADAAAEEEDAGEDAGEDAQEQDADGDDCN